MDIFSLLHQDHENVATIFKKFEAMTKQETPETGERLFNELYTELNLHAQVEEDIVYPFFEEKPETRDIVEESLKEHEEIESLLAELKGMRPDDSNWKEWKSKLDDLKEQVEHHVREEEGEFFPKAQSIVSAEQAREMGETVEATKKELRGEQSAYKEAS